MIEHSRPLLIGDFARRCRLPVSTLRYYDRIGLLVPAAVDPVSGYRRYTAAQLPSAVLVARLRALGTAPREIRRVLDGGADAAAALAGERLRIRGQIRERQRALGQLDLLTQEDCQPGRVHLVELAPARVAAVPLHTPAADLTAAVLRGIAALRAILRRAGCERTGPWGATFPMDVTEQVSGLVFARTARPAGHPDVDDAWLPAGPAARIVHHGAPDTVALAYAAAFDLLDRHGLQPTGPVVEEYPSLDSPRPADGEIRVSVPVAPG